MWCSALRRASQPRRPCDLSRPRHGPDRLQPDGGRLLGHSRSPSHRGSRMTHGRSTTLAIAVLLVLSLVGCKSEPADSKSANPASTDDVESAPTDGVSVTADTVAPPARPQAPPRPIGTWPDGYAALMIDTPLAVGLVAPRDLAREVEDGLR